MTDFKEKAQELVSHAAVPERCEHGGGGIVKKRLECLACFTSIVSKVESALKEAYEQGVNDGQNALLGAQKIQELMKP